MGNRSPTEPPWEGKRDSGAWQATSPEVQGVSVRTLEQSGSNPPALESAVEHAVLGKLHEVNLALLREEALPTLLKAVINAAVEVSCADRGTFQLYDRNAGTLDLVAQNGFDQESIEHSEIVDACDRAISRAALRLGHRVIVEDVWRNPVFRNAPSMEIMRAAQVRAIQASPLRARDGALIGVMATYWSEPHRPDAATLLALDLLARQAVDLIEYRQNRETFLSTNDRIENFLEILAHELRNPLAAIFSGVQALCKMAWSPGAAPSRAGLDRATNQSFGATR